MDIHCALHALSISVRFENFAVGADQTLREYVNDIVKWAPQIFFELRPEASCSPCKMIMSWDLVLQYEGFFSDQHTKY